MAGGGGLETRGYKDGWPQGGGPYGLGAEDDGGGVVVASRVMKLESRDEGASKTQLLEEGDEAKSV